MMLGRLDEVDGHYVATKFFVFAIPTGSVYVPSEPSRRTTGSGRPSSVAIRLDLKSVALAYARVWLPLLGVALPILGVATGHHVPWFAWMMGLMLVAIGAISRRSGRLSDAEKARLRLLGTITGMRLDPAKLLPDARTVKRDSLGALMDKGGIPIARDEIIAVLEDIPIPALPLVYAFARYAGDDPAWVECAETVYSRHERAELLSG